MSTTALDAWAVRTALPKNAPSARRALGRPAEKARRFDNALLIAMSEDAPVEVQALARRIATELQGK